MNESLNCGFLCSVKFYYVIYYVITMFYYAIYTDIRLM